MCICGTSVITTLLGCDGTAPPSSCDDNRLAEASIVAEFDMRVDEQDLTQAEIDALLLAEIPVELQLVLDDEDRFTITADHPLRNVRPGADRDDVDALNGCWGRIETERTTSSDGSETIEFVVAEAWRIDLRSEQDLTLDSYKMTGVFGVPCSEDDRPRIQSLAWSILEITEATVRIRASVGASAGLNTDGSLSTHEVARAFTYLPKGDAEISYTVEGDNLMTSEEGYDPDNPSTEDIDLWVRFECVR